MINFIHGSDTFRAKQFIHQTVQKIQSDHPGSTVQNIDASNIEFSQLTALLQPWQLFSAKTIIILKNPLANRSTKVIDFLNQYLQLVNDDVFLIIWEQNPVDRRKVFFKNIKKNKIPQQEFIAPKPHQVSGWLENYCRAEQIKISKEAIQLLSRLHHDTYRLHQELTKLKILTDNQITVQDVQKISPPSIHHVIFDLTDQIGQKNPIAFRTAQDLIAQGHYPPVLLAALATHIANLIIIKTSLGQTEHLKHSRLHPYVIEKGRRQCQNFTLPELIQIYHLIALADRQIKSGQTNFEQLIFSIITPKKEKV
jgi:DNA polymerase III delta subunit